MKINFSFQQKFVIFCLVLVGLTLRLVWDPHRIIWSFDQARDSFVVRELLRNFDLILVGPQTEYYGLFHGPLYYYFIAPFYALAGGETPLPVLAITLLTYSSIFPLYLLINSVTKSRLAGIFGVFVFSVSYAFIEYARWLSNFSLAIPFLIWSYFFLFQILKKKERVKNYFLLGVAVGLSIQAEMFFGIYAVTVFLALVLQRRKLKNIISYVLGGAFGLLPLILSEIKFGFRGALILLGVLKTDASGLNPSSSILGYIKHLGLSTKFAVSGGQDTFALIVLLALVSLFIYFFRKNIEILSLILIIALSHFALFFFNYVDAVFLDLGFSTLLVIIFSLVLFKLLVFSKPLFFGIIALFLLFQANNYKLYLLSNRPFDHYRFIQEPSTLYHKEQVLEAIYHKAGGREFSFASFGTPFGVRTVWASVFELYARENKLQIPKWYGYYANGYPGENIFEIAKKPSGLHVVLLESNLSGLVPEPIVREHMGNQDTHTKIDEEIVVNDTVIQFRSPR